MDVVRIPLVDTMKFGGRDVDAATVKMLRESMAAVGLLNPVLVRKGQRQDGPTSRETYWIIAGRHRVEAARAIGWTEIDAVITDLDTAHAELCEIDENLARSELSDAARARAHARRREIMVDLGLVSRPGRGGDRRSNEESSLGSYAEKTAAGLGVSKRMIEKDLARGDNIDPSVLAQVQDTSLDRGTVLDDLAGLPKGEQPARLAELKLLQIEKEQQRKAATKATRDTDRSIALIEAQRFGEWLMARTDLNELDTIISWLEGTKPKDVIAALRREAA